MVSVLFALTCLASVLLGVTSFILFFEFKNHTEKVLSLVSGGAWEDPILASLKQKIEMLADPNDLRANSLVSIDRRTDVVEQADADQTVNELFEEVARHCRLAFSSQITLSSLELYTKSVYRLQHELGFSDDDMSDVLAATVTRIKGVSMLGKAVDKVEFVKTGDRVDEKIMWPLNHGLRVKQPFGFVLRTDSGDVLSKAKVACR